MSEANLVILVGILSAGLFMSVAMLITKMGKLRIIQKETGSLRKSLDEMDEQAKLIIRTDMELNKTQEELDKKVNGLYALQRFSRAISTTLDEAFIFQKVDAGCLEDLGFEKATAWIWEAGKKLFSPRLEIGYDEEEMSAIRRFIEANQSAFLKQIEEEKTYSSFSGNYPLKTQVGRVFKAASFVISALNPKESNKGFIFVGTGKVDTVVTEGDEELITILANQIAQALDNSRLFDKTWRAQQELERKVDERTSQLSGALNEVQKISRRKTDFISSVSHELRTPLTSIKGYAAILLAGKLGAIPQEVKERLEKINHHSDELVHMVNDLLDIARIESGKTVMQRSLCSLKDISAKVSDMLSVQAKEKHIDLSVDVRPDADKLTADASQIERVLINLIFNAIKFTPEKGKITVRAALQEGMIKIDVADTGCGVPADAQEAIFEEFYRVDNEINQTAKGTGLGLSLAKNIVEAHKGKIWVTSKPGTGSTFSFTIPKA